MATTKSTVRNGHVTISNKRTGKTILHFKEGGLHDSLGIPRDQKIPLAKVKQAKHSSNPLIKKEATLALNMRKFKKK